MSCEGSGRCLINGGIVLWQEFHRKPGPRLPVLNFDDIFMRKVEFTFLPRLISISCNTACSSVCSSLLYSTQNLFSALGGFLHLKSSESVPAAVSKRVSSCCRPALY